MALRVGHNNATPSESFRQERIRSKLFSARVAGVAKALAEKFENFESPWYSRHEVVPFLCSCREQRDYESSGKRIESSGDSIQSTGFS